MPDAAVQSYQRPWCDEHGNRLNLFQVMLGTRVETGRGLSPTQIEDRQKRKALEDKKVQDEKVKQPGHETSKE
jgi:hypothetical protein